MAISSNIAVTQSLLSRFQGCLVGAVLGDCLGARFEGECLERSVNPVIKYFNDINKCHKTGGNKIIKEFTDDTAMARSVAATLIERKPFDLKDCAQRFVSEYYNEEWRGYGGAVISVFSQLRDSNCDDPFKPASKQFDGSGSYGNGGAMRIAPAALYGLKYSAKEMCRLADQITMLTHTHPDGMNGARLQCLAVQYALKHNKEIFSSDSFLDQLHSDMDMLEDSCEKDEAVSDDTGTGSPTCKKKRTSDKPYCQKILTIKDLLHQEDVTRTDVIELLGNDISALGSAPTALYCFLRCFDSISDIHTENMFERTIIYAISLGGDTDTIASMAGAIAGAYHGIDILPNSWLDICEGVDTAKEQAEKLFEPTEST